MTLVTRDGEIILRGPGAFRGDVWVELDSIGEGYNGEYDETDPTDEEMLRFTVYQWVDGDWEALDDGSYCTLLPASIDDELYEKAAAFLLEKIYPAVQEGNWKKLCERLSWIEPKWLETDPVHDHGALADV